MSTRATKLILFADSDPELRQMVNRTLYQYGYDVLDTDSARNVLPLARQHRPDVIVLEIDFPDLSGFEICTRLRAMPFVNHTPLMFLSTQHSAEYVARALDCGADDFLRKPFAMSELSARVRAMLRRVTHKRFYTPATLHLDPQNHSVIIDTRHVFLTPTEFSLLEHLCVHQAEHHTAHTLLEELWEYPPGDGDTALVRNHIRNLRRKIEENPNNPRIIISLHGRGYTVNARVARPSSATI